MTEFGLVVPKYFWVVTFLVAQNFEVDSGLFENVRTPVLSHCTFCERKS
jgi:hypothetical protein